MNVESKPSERKYVAIRKDQASPLSIQIFKKIIWELNENVSNRLMNVQTRVPATYIYKD